MKVYTVGQVNNYIKNIITQDYMLKSITIKGEVSNCKYHSLGHIYFSLKDETGTIPAVMFKGNVAAGLDFRLKDGQAVVVSGSIGVYERDGRYQLYASKIKLDGGGRLFEEFERLKYKLNEEGLFDFDHKKKIPAYPDVVGIVTAGTGAAIQDIMNIAKRRNPYVQLILYPAKVQGEGAAGSIVRGIRKLDAMGLDTIIVGRGGGSMEDLWAFNEEIVARAIYEAKTPIISGVGHEVDITLADYAADLRAPTPSAACELAIPDVMTALDRLDKQSAVLRAHMDKRMQNLSLMLEAYSSKLEVRNPSKKIEGQTQYLAELYDRLRAAMERKYTDYAHALEVYTARLDGLSPTARLVNGFGYIEGSRGPVRGAAELKKGELLNITLHDGRISAEVLDVNISEGKIGEYK